MTESKCRKCRPATGNDEDVRLQLRVIPRASRDGWGGQRGERQVVRLTAPPEDGKANARLKKFLATEFGTSIRAITIERGQTSRDKTVRIEGAKRAPKFPHGV